MVYANSKDPDISCETCRKTYTSFPGIVSDQLRHAGPWYQCLQLHTHTLGTAEGGQIIDYIQRWTGLTRIEFSITL